MDSLHEDEGNTGDGYDSSKRAIGRELNLKEELIAANLTRYEHFIVKGVKAAELMSLMPDIEKPVKNRIRLIEETKGCETATEALLKWLRESTVEGRYTAFVDALRIADYESIPDVLLGKAVNDTGDQEKLIELFARPIEDKVDPVEILPDLIKENLINRRDMEEIQTAKDSRCRFSSCVKMLDCIPRRRSDWFEPFLHILANNGYEKLVKDIDDVIYGKWKVGKNTRKDSFREEPDQMDVDLDMSSSCDTNGTMENVAYDSGEAVDDGNLCAQLLDSPNEEDTPDRAPPTAPDDADTKVKEIIYLGDSIINGQEAGLPATSDPQNIMTREELLKKTAENTKYMQDFLGIGGINDIDDAMSVIDNSSYPNGDESDEDDGRQYQPKKPINLRSYQKELAEPALDGGNTVIVAPTSSGKTHVALKIIETHMERLKDQSIPKIVFIVEQSLLAVQQGKLCKEHLNGKVKVITGEIQKNESLQKISIWLKKYDILVVTAQLLVNALIVKDVNIQQFTLMVFDECHHTNIKHPFNQIMNSYLDIKLTESEYSRSLPQVVGLTASVGVGKARNEGQAVEWIEKIMAHLDADNLSTVRKNMKDLSGYVAIAQQATVQVQRRKNNTFGEVLESLMNTVVRYMAQSEYVRNSSELLKLVTPPSTIGCDQYTQWISTLRRGISEKCDSKARRFLLSCREYLDVYNRAMIIYADARVEDAMKFLDDQVSRINGCLKKDTTDTNMETIYKRSKETVLGLCLTAKDQGNPKLERLEKMLTEMYEENEESRGIIFVKTRDLAEAIKTWIQEAEGLQHLRLEPGVLSGAHAALDKGGMTKHGQGEVMHSFRSGKHKIIVATSVAEEGLDIQKCNFVIRYNISTNEIAMVQSRGRGRAEGSNYTLLTEEGGAAAAKEELNIVRESMMNNAIVQLQEQIQKNKAAFRRGLTEIQRKEKNARDEGKVQKRANNKGEFDIRCEKCDQFICMAGDVRKIKDQHHAVLCPDVVNRVNVKKCNKPPYQDVDLQAGIGKVHCCDCGKELGNVTLYKGTQFAILKCMCIVFADSMGNNKYCKRWKQAPFTPLEMSEEDLKRWRKSYRELIPSYQD